MQFAFDDEQQTETNNKQLFGILEFIRIRRGEKRNARCQVADKRNIHIPDLLQHASLVKIKNDMINKAQKHVCNI
jgi:hypothetical protein